MFVRKIRISEREHGIVAVALLPFCCVLATPAPARQTPAGTAIVNTASLHYGAPNTRVTTLSNSVTLRVDETIDVAIEARADVIEIAPSATDVRVAFVVTNTGNGSETFALSADAGVTLSVGADVGDGVYAGSTDRGTSLTLGPGQAGVAFAMVPGPVNTATRVAMTATAITGKAKPGTVFAGRGVDGVDAVIGASGGSTVAYTTLTPDNTAPALVKSQSVVGPDGSVRVMPGSIITYRLEARFVAAMRDAVVSDDLPAGTTFVPNSITLDDQPQTDAADADAASFDGRTVRVSLGEAASAAVRTIRFQTKIN